MVLGKEDLWERIRTKSIWMLMTRTPFFLATEEHMHATINMLQERYIRYIVSLHFQGNGISHTSGSIEKLKEDGTYEMKWSDVQIAPAAMPQIPEGSYDIENPIISIEGGTNLFGRVSGNSINLTITYWDNDL